MKWLVVLIVVLGGAAAASAQQSQSIVDWMAQKTRDWWPTLSIPSLPDMPMLDYSQIGDRVLKEFDDFTQQVGATLPILEEMGYEVSTFRVQWGLPPKAKLRLRSRTTTDAGVVQAAYEKATGGRLMKALVFSAAEAKRVQQSMKLGMAVIDVEFALKPKIRMSFLNNKLDTALAGRLQRNDSLGQDFEDLDLMCGQALAAN